MTTWEPPTAAPSPRAASPRASTRLGLAAAMPEPPPPLPTGWTEAQTETGEPYFFDEAGNTVWDRPTRPAAG